MHDNIACERCHKDNRPLAGSGNLCINCHRQDDIHNNSLSPRCGECHTQWSFAPARFDHTRVGCNLTGLHRTIACFDCHKSGNYVGLSAQCVSCHATMRRARTAALRTTATDRRHDDHPRPGGDLWSLPQPELVGDRADACAADGFARPRIGVPMKRWLVLGLVLAAMSPVWAKGDKKSKKPADDDSADTSDSDDDSDKSDDDDKKPDKKADKKKAEKKAADKKAADKKKSKKGDKKADKGDSDDDDDAPDKSDKKKAGKDDSDDDDKKSDKKSDKNDKADKKATRKPPKDDDDATAGFSGDDASADETGSSKVKKTDDEASETNGSAELAKQDLTGHDLGTKKKTNEFERDRFFVDKTDTEATENGTLIQGSLTSSSFCIHRERRRLRSPDDGRHRTRPHSRASSPISGSRPTSATSSGGRWDARIDARVRVVNGEPLGRRHATAAGGPRRRTHIQSGLTGQNEYDLRELWLIRNGERTDVIFGRQFIPDLARDQDRRRAHRLRELEEDHLPRLRRPLSAARLAVDHDRLRRPQGSDHGDAGRQVRRRGRFRRRVSHVDGVRRVRRRRARAVRERRRVTRGSSRPRTATGASTRCSTSITSRSSISSRPTAPQITNLSGGLNYKPNQRLRLTASFNRVDTDTLNIQAQRVPRQPAGRTRRVQNET